MWLEKEPAVQGTHDIAKSRFEQALHPNNKELGDYEANEKWKLNPTVRLHWHVIVQKSKRGGCLEHA